MGGGAVRGSENGKCLSAFYVVAHFSLTKLNDWLSVPFRMVSGSKNPHSGQPTTGKMPHATCHMQHVSAAPLNCISLPNTSIITPKKKIRSPQKKKTKYTRQHFSICNKLATNNQRPTTCCIGQLLRLITATHYVNDWVFFLAFLVIVCIFRFCTFGFIFCCIRRHNKNNATTICGSVGG